MFSYERVRLVGGLVICVRWIWCGRYCWHFSCLFLRTYVCVVYGFNLYVSGCVLVVPEVVC